MICEHGVRCVCAATLLAWVVWVVISLVVVVCWVCRGGEGLMGEAVWLGGAGDRAETSIDRFQSVRGVLGGESRRCDRGLRVIVVHLSSPQIPRSPFPSLLSGVTQVRGHSEWILRVVAEAPNEMQMSSRMHWWSRRILMVTLAP